MPLFSPHHVLLISACYPPSSALLTAGPEYRPNSQELSRLTYYASNRPGKVTKLGAELERRARKECNKAQAGYPRYKASLLITLNIFKALATECRRDISLLSPSLVASVAATLNALLSDLEVSAKAASLFTAWTTYTNGQLIGVDTAVTASYMSALQNFSSLSCVEAKSDDYEDRNRTRLVGLAALRGAANSEALYNDSAQFVTQVSTIIHPVLVIQLQSDISVLDVQAADVKLHPISPYLAEFRNRPAIERRAASIHVHIDGENGPSTADVTHACLQVFFCLLDHSNGAQLGHLMKAAFDTLDKLQGWQNIALCCWFAQKASEWSQYQYRYAVPRWLVDRLLEGQDAPASTMLHRALAAMITTVFNSPTPLGNLSTSDIISNLITLVFRRVAIDPHDPLLPDLVGCIASLGSHVYYSDQIQDLAGELINRLAFIEVHGLARGSNKGDHSRSQALRTLLAGLLELMRAANKNETFRDQDPNRSPESPIAFVEAPTSFSASADASNGRLARRSRVAPDTWQDTLTLLCDRDYAIRADYARTLVFYLCSEIRQRSEATDTDGVRRPRPPLGEGPAQQATNVTVLLHGDTTTRFLNAMHAYVYILAMATSFASGAAPKPVDTSSKEPIPALSVQPATPLDESTSPLHTLNSEEHPTPSSPQRPSICTLPRTHKESIIQRLLLQVPSQISSSTIASPSDYAHVLAILTATFERLPVRGLLTGVPMLLALDGGAKIEDVKDTMTWQRFKTVKEVAARAWAIIAKVWDSAELVDMAANAISSIPGASYLPSPARDEDQILPPLQNIVLFPSGETYTASTTWSGVNTEAALLALVSSPNLQEATQLDRQGLLRRFNVKWTPHSALKDSVEKPSNFEGFRADAMSPLLRISPALMQGENLSMQSLARSSRGVGVTDLREALEGRGCVSNPALVASTISTLERASSRRAGADTFSPNELQIKQLRSRRRPATSGTGEVRDVLERLGIGKPQNGSLLRASFPALQKLNDRSTIGDAPS